MRLNLHRAGPRSDAAAGTLVLLHGLGSRWQMWQPVLPALSERFDVIAVDLPGFGDSPMPAPDAAARPGAATLSDLLIESLSELGIGPGEFHVAGNSLGGLTALELARRGVVRSTCALSPAGFATDLEMRVTRATLGTSVRIARALAPRADVLMARPRARVLLTNTFFARPQRIPRAVAADDMRAMAGAPWFDATLAAVIESPRAAPADVSAPVTIAWGTKDRVLFPRGARRAAARLPRARVVMLPGCGHVPTWDDPPLVARVMLEATGVA